MKSRMERYYQLERRNSENSASSKRTVLNRNLYDKIYDDVEYSNIEGVAELDIKNEIDIEKIRDLLKSKEELDAGKRREIVKKRQQDFDKKRSVTEDRTYDIRDILSKAKEERQEEPSIRKSLRNTQYDMLKNIDIEKEMQKLEDKNRIDKDESEIDELVSTIANTNLIDNLADRELSLDLLDDLKSPEDTITTENTSIRRLIDAEKRAKAENHHKEDEEKIDKSFFTSGISFDKEDFEQALEEEHVDDKDKIILKIFLFIFFVLLAIASAVGLYVFLT